MATSYDQALSTLYQAPLDAFVAERKRLVLELKQSGDKEGAARLAKLVRPPLSAWAVNQLYWRERPRFNTLFESAAALRNGDLQATKAHREALAALRSRAAELLAQAGHSASEATLRKVTTTLSALAATGSFAPDPPGALGADREPPGFDAFGLALGSGGASDSATQRDAAPSSSKAPRIAAPPSAQGSTESEREAAERLEAERLEAERLEAERLEAERRRQEEERKRAEEERKRQERRRLEAELREAKSLLEERIRELMQAEDNARAARARVEALKQQLEALK